MEEIQVYKSAWMGSDKEIVAFSGNEDECLKFIGLYAQKYNYGIFRTWNVNGKRYYDCGPETFYIKEKSKEEEK